MTTAQKIIQTIHVLLFSLYTLFIIGAYFNEKGTCQMYNRSFECLSYKQPQIVQYLFIWILGVTILTAITAPINHIWRAKEEKPQHYNHHQN
jgi:hypothetical protein